MPRASETAAKMNRIAGKALTAELRKLAEEVYTVLDNGDQQTRSEALAAMIWRQALGWVEETRDESGNLVKKVHPPVAWCQQFLFERQEGRAPVASSDNEGGVRAAEKVRQLAKERVAAMTAKVAGPSGPPTYKPNKE